MIKYNLQNINDWNFGDDNIIKVYYDNAVCYYKVISSGGTTAQTPCFAVVDDISQYQETEFEDVFNKADNSWYKLNNLSQYEKYGLYGSGLSITTYEGKLTVDNGYEYIYSGGSWVSVGEVSGGTRVPQGYTEYDYVSNNSNAYIDTGLLLYSATSNTFKIESTLYSSIVDYSQTYQNIITCLTEVGEPYQGFVYRFESYMLKPRANPSSDVVFSTVDNGDGTSAVTITCSTGITYTHDYPLVIGCGLDDSKNPFRFTNTSIYSFKLTLNNSLTLDYIPCKRDSDNVYGVYDAVGNTFITSSNSHPFTGGSPSTASTAVIYPMYYSEKSDPLDNLTFNTMAEALAYECPWVGMTATIDGTAYMFCESNEWLTKYSYVEVTGDYLCENGNKYKKMQEYVRQADGTLTPTSNYVIGDLIEAESPDCGGYENQYLTFVAKDSGTFKFSGNSISYSLDDGNTWATLASNTNSPTVTSGNKIMWKSSLTPSTNGIGRFSSTAQFDVEGNAMSLLYGDNFIGSTTLPDKAFMYLFSGCTQMMSAENLILPAKTMSSSGYAYMFDTCTSLTKIPELPATTLAPHCYRTTFGRCSSLTSVRENYLPVTTMAEACYINMFIGCTSLTKGPDLPATTLAIQCYQGLFNTCPNLNSITCLATDISANRCTSSWVTGVASSGTFIKAPSMTSWTRGTSGIPNGWTVQDYSE